MTNKTALVTGASSGIGEALARQLAEGGHDLVLVARTHSKLEALSRELASRHGISAHVIAADLARPTAALEIYEQTRSLGLGVDILVNNAGFGSHGQFLDLDLGRELEMIQVNVASLVGLSHAFGRGMRERGFGHILNIASTAGFQPGPFMATYYASKAFVIAFSLALAHELRGSGVRVTCHCPGPVDTPFADRAGTRHNRLFHAAALSSAEQVASHAYRAMLAGRNLAVPGALNRVGAASVRFLPRHLVASVVATLNNRDPRRAASLGS